MAALKQNRNMLIGRWGEHEAARFLVERGYSIVEINYRTPHGEIDLIATKEAQVIFFEVKARTSVKFGYPEASITSQKKQHMLSAVECYLETHVDMESWQYDVLAIRRQPTGFVEIVHFENVLA